jgi:hypothetical protein
MKSCKGRTALYVSVFLNVAAFMLCFYILETRYGIRHPSAIFTIPYFTACYFLCKKKKWANFVYKIYAYFEIFMGVFAVVVETKKILPQNSSVVYGIYVILGLVNCVTLISLYCNPIRSYLREPPIDSSKRKRKH